MTIKSLIEKRKSIRKFKDMQVDEKIILDILEAGRLSPSGGNQQPWQFFYTTEKHKMSDIADIAYGQKWISGAGLVIVICTEYVSQEDKGRWIQESRFPKYKDRIEAMGELYELLNLEEHQDKIPATQMTLQALEYGVYSTMVSYFDVEKLKSYLSLDRGLIPGLILVFGYPEESLTPRKKKALDAIVRKI